MTTRKRFYASCPTLLLLMIFAASFASAQVILPRPSQKASVMQRIGVTDVTITYSRPGVKGRRIWGDPLPSQAAVKGEATLDNQNVRPKDAVIVPWGHAWRTGANEATQFVITDEVCINGQKLPAGSYRTNGPSSSTARPTNGGALTTMPPRTRCASRQSRSWKIITRSG